MQTDTHRATMSNTLSKEQEESITFCQGHSQAVSKRFYEMKDKEKAAKQTISAHQILYGEMPSLNIRKRNLQDDEFIPDDQLEDEAKEKRIKWTPEQESWILNWMEQYKTDVLFNGSMNWKRCIKDIQSTPEALQIFPPSHHDPSKSLNVYITVHT
jgi:hypothetical protein